VQFLGGYDLHHLAASGGEYDVGIMCHIWFENSPLVLLEHLHAGKFVVSTRLGGPVEWIRPNENGLFYPAGNPEELADCLRRLVVGEVPIPSPREIHAASALRSYAEYVAEVEGIYAELLSAEKTSDAGVDSTVPREWKR
jgi:glycosyltransferase involved in cell wall biosynthesis